MANKRLPRFSLVPQYIFREITDVTTDFLEQNGIKLLILDLDNTIAAYDEHKLADSIAQWIADIRGGCIDLFIISNSTRKKRVTSFAESIGVGFIMQSGKPSPKSVLRAMEITGFDSGETALAGDQIFTDALAANRAGVVSIIVQPRRFTNPFLTLRYYVEIPFRAMCRNKQ